MKYHKRHYMTLLELIIAMSLTAIILTTLMYFYQQVTWINTEMDRVQSRNFQKRFVEKRLSEVIPKAIPKKKKDFHFFISLNGGELFKPRTTSLLFTFDNCVKLNKQMSYHVIGRLYLDNEGNFTLATWPIPKRWKENENPPMFKEILLENVESLSFEFFVPPDKGKTEIDNGIAKLNEKIPLEIRGQWVTDWKKEYRELPAIVRVKLKHNLDGEVESLTFAFPLPHTSRPIIYDQ